MIFTATPRCATLCSAAICSAAQRNAQSFLRISSAALRPATHRTASRCSATLRRSATRRLPLGTNLDFHRTALPRSASTRTSPPRNAPRRLPLGMNLDFRRFARLRDASRRSASQLTEPHCISSLRNVTSSFGISLATRRGATLHLHKFSRELNRGFI
jgi:hypothetical protein